jgi:hypothetical protein
MEAIMTPTPTHDLGEEIVDLSDSVEAPTPVFVPHGPTDPSDSPDTPRQPAHHRHRKPARRTAAFAVALGLGLIAATGITAAVVRITRDDPTAPPPTVVDDDARLRELVERGLVPAEALEPLVDDDARLRELVERGLVPGQALEPLVDDDARSREPAERRSVRPETPQPLVPGNVS